MAMDILWLGGIFEFLKKFLNTRHTTSLLRLLDAVPNQDVEVSLLIERELISYNGKLVAADSVEGPGGNPGKVDHGRVAVRGEGQGQIPDNGGNTEFVGAEHKTYDDRNKPAERNLPRETGFKLA